MSGYRHEELLRQASAELKALSHRVEMLQLKCDTVDMMARMNRTQNNMGMTTSTSIQYQIDTYLDQLPKRTTDGTDIRKTEAGQDAAIAEKYRHIRESEGVHPSGQVFDRTDVFDNRPSSPSPDVPFYPPSTIRNNMD